MEKRIKGHCKRCNRDVGEENLSNQKQCYVCAKERMLRAFDWLWKTKYRGGIK